eukprot:gene27188-2431_t
MHQRRPNLFALPLTPSSVLCSLLVSLPTFAPNPCSLPKADLGAPHSHAREYSAERALLNEISSVVTLLRLPRAVLPQGDQPLASVNTFEILYQNRASESLYGALTSTPDHSPTFDSPAFWSTLLCCTYCSEVDVLVQDIFGSVQSGDVWRYLVKYPRAVESQWDEGTQIDGVLLESEPSSSPRSEHGPSRRPNGPSTSRSGSITLGKSEAALVFWVNQSFPRHIIEFLSTSSPNEVPGNVGTLARSHDEVTVLFMDIVGFTSMSKDVEAEAVLTFLNQLFTHFDLLCDSHMVQKVETAGDCYIVAGGILEFDEESGFYSVQDVHDPVKSAAKVLAFAKDMIRVSKLVTMPHNGEPVVIRIGMHTGKCVSGLIGTKLPKFSIFGDTMNTASRMESTSKHGCIQISAHTHELLVADTSRGITDVWESTGGVEIKGKGLMQTYLHTPAAERSDVGFDLLMKHLHDPSSSIHTVGSSPLVQTRSSDLPGLPLGIGINSQVIQLIQSTIKETQSTTWWNSRASGGTTSPRARSRTQSSSTSNWSPVPGNCEKGNRRMSMPVPHRPSDLRLPFPEAGEGFNSTENVRRGGAPPKFRTTHSHRRDSVCVSSATSQKGIQSWGTDMMPLNDAEGCWTSAQGVQLNMPGGGSGRTMYKYGAVKSPMKGKTYKSAKVLQSGSAGNSPLFPTGAPRIRYSNSGAHSLLARTTVEVLGGARGRRSPSLPPLSGESAPTPEFIQILGSRRPHPAPSKGEGSVKAGSGYEDSSPLDAARHDVSFSMGADPRGVPSSIDGDSTSANSCKVSEAGSGSMPVSRVSAGGLSKTTEEASLSLKILPHPGFLAHARGSVQTSAGNADSKIGMNSAGCADGDKGAGSPLSQEHLSDLVVLGDREVSSPPTFSTHAGGLAQSSHAASTALAATWCNLPSVHGPKVGVPDSDGVSEASLIGLPVTELSMSSLHARVAASQPGQADGAQSWEAASGPGQAKVQAPAIRAASGSQVAMVGRPTPGAASGPGQARVQALGISTARGPQPALMDEKSGRKMGQSTEPDEATVVSCFHSVPHQGKNTPFAFASKVVEWSPLATGSHTLPTRRKVSRGPSAQNFGSALKIAHAIHLAMPLERSSSVSQTKAPTFITSPGDSPTAGASGRAATTRLLSSLKSVSFKKGGQEDLGVHRSNHSLSYDKKNRRRSTEVQRSGISRQMSTSVGQFDPSIPKPGSEIAGRMDITSSSRPAPAAIADAPSAPLNTKSSLDSKLGQNLTGSQPEPETGASSPGIPEPSAEIAGRRMGVVMQSTVCRSIKVTAGASREPPPHLSIQMAPSVPILARSCRTGSQPEPEAGASSPGIPEASAEIAGCRVGVVTQQSVKTNQYHGRSL